ncbi:MAG: PEP-utilizing enzyme [Patescibacteria group bacterium]
MKKSVVDNKIIDLNGYQIIPEASRSSHLYIAEVVANYCWQKHDLFPINTITIVEYKDSKFQIYYAVKDKNHFLSALDRFTKKPNLLNTLENYLTTVREGAISYISAQPTLQLTDKKLGNLLSFYYIQTQELHKAAMTLRLIDRGVLEYFKNSSGHLKNADYSSLLSASSRQSFATQENIALLTLADKVSQKIIKSKSDIYNKELKKIYNKFHWLSLGYYDEPLSTLISYENRVKVLIKKNPNKLLKNIKKNFIKEQRERMAIVNKLSKKDKLVAKVTGEVSYLKDYFKFSTNKLQLFGEGIFQEISRRTGVSVEDIKDLSHADAINLAAGKKYNKKETAIYQRHTVFVSLTGKIRLKYIGAFADKYAKKFLAYSKNITGEFTGRTACKGSAIGKAKIVHSPKDFHKVNKGDILVVMNTGPDFVPILSRVGAIVAEEGGITAHVSVISREMKIPCVVGLSHVSKEIKDDDWLEVDANQGIVKILKRK